MLGSKSCELAVELDDTRLPFYTPGSPVKGRVRLTVLVDSITLRDIQVRLRCVEYSAVAQEEEGQQGIMEAREAIHARKVARRRQKGKPSRKGDTFSSSKPASYIDHKEHLDLACDLERALDIGVKDMVFQKGSHSFDFSVIIPEAANMLPPYSPVPTRNHLRIGIEWTIGAKARRSGYLRGSVSAQTPVHVHPTLKPISRTDLARRAELSGQKSVAQVKKASGLTSLFRSSDPDAAARERENQLIMRLTYPEAGLPHGPLVPEFGLTLEAPHNPVPVTRVALYLVQRCLASIQSPRRPNDTYRNKILLGSANVDRTVQKNPEDLTSLVQTFHIPSVFAAPFASQLLTVSYDLRLIVACRNPDNKDVTLVLETPVNLIGPAACWPLTEKSGMLESSAKPAVQDSHAAHGNGGLPTYEEALPTSQQFQGPGVDVYSNTKH